MFCHIFQVFLRSIASVQWPGTLFFFTFTSDDVFSSMNGPLVSFQAETDKWWTRLWATALDRRIFRSHCELWLMLGCFTTLTIIKLHLFYNQCKISRLFYAWYFLKTSLLIVPKESTNIYHWRFSKVSKILVHTSNSMTVIIWAEWINPYKICLMTSVSLHK